MYCFHCGKEIKDDSRFCIYCGTEQARAAPTGGGHGPRRHVILPWIITIIAVLLFLFVWFYRDPMCGLPPPSPASDTPAVLEPPSPAPAVDTSAGYDSSTPPNQAPVQSNTTISNTGRAKKLPSKGQTADGLTYEVSKDSVRITGYQGASASVYIPAMIEGVPVTWIGEEAFMGSDVVEKVTIADGVIHIGDRAFQNCTFLSEVIISESVISLGKDCFRSCLALQSLKIPKGAGELYGNPASHCFGLKRYIVTDGNFSFQSVDDILYTKGMRELRGYPPAKKGSSFTVPDGVALIGRDAFGSCMELEKITLSDTVNRIAPEAFSYCASLREIRIPASVKQIDEGAFRTCFSLKDVYYGGTKAEWNEILIQGDNDYLTAATIHFSMAG